MSEYQCYHFQTVGRLLSEEEQQEVDGLSSHIDVSASEASVEYSYGSFKHDPIRVLSRYFDFLIYRASWGSQTLAFRFDDGAVDVEALRVYEIPDILSIDKHETNIIVHISFDENFTGGWIDPDDPNPRLFARLHEETGRGDHRALFLMWLKACELSDAEYDEKPPSIPVPAGLGELHKVHKALADLIDLDADYIAAAKEKSPPLSAANADDFNPADHLHLLTPDERHEAFMQFFAEDPRRARSTWERTLRNRVAEANGSEGSAPSPLISFDDLWDAVNKMDAIRESERQEEADRRRQVYLHELERHESELLPAAEAWIGTKMAKGYDAAVELLKGLEDLVNHRGGETVAAFRTQVDEIARKYPRLSALQARLIAAGLKAATSQKLAYWEQRRQEQLTEQFGTVEEIDFALLRGPRTS